MVMLGKEKCLDNFMETSDMETRDEVRNVEAGVTIKKLKLNRSKTLYMNYQFVKKDLSRGLINLDTKDALPRKGFI